jgi:predicted TIM-barrel fold metal-dependent hydrolase
MEGMGMRPGLPSTERMASWRIWDAYFTPSFSRPGRDGSTAVMEDIERSLPAIRLARMERLCLFAHVGLGTTTDAEFESAVRKRPEMILKPWERWPRLLLGMIQVNAADLKGSLDAIDRWVRDGPMLGVYLPGGGPAAVVCTHPNVERIVERVAALEGVIMQHTWIKTGGKQGPGESTPSELARLAGRHPDQPFICAHAGGEWEKGLLAVRSCGNVLVETSGFDATAGFVQMAVREIGDERVIFGSHLPSRSLGTELGKVLSARLTGESQGRILGGNYRKLLKGQFRRKGWALPGEP